MAAFLTAFRLTHGGDDLEQQFVAVTAHEPSDELERAVGLIARDAPTAKAGEPHATVLFQRDVAAQ
jgi:hypothetical protein